MRGHNIQTVWFNLFYGKQTVWNDKRLSSKFSRISIFSPLEIKAQSISQYHSFSVDQALVKSDGDCAAVLGTQAFGVNCSSLRSTVCKGKGRRKGKCYNCKNKTVFISIS